MPIIDLVDAIHPGAVDYSLVIKQASGVKDQLANAKYAVSIARKIGASVFALPEDLIEVKPKMTMATYAALMAADLSTAGTKV